jgi:trk system potassium uptake protein TrkA
MFASKEIFGIIIAGGGRFGRCLANQLDSAEENVTVVDINGDSFNKLPPDFKGSTLEGDASSIEVLRQAGINRTRAVISATGNDNVNLMIAQIARDIYKVPTVIAVVNDPMILSAKDGFDFLILCPSLVMAQAVINDLKVKEA